MKEIFQKNIYLVPFPFSDFSSKKVRPVLILSNDKFNKNSEDLIVCAITIVKEFNIRTNSNIEFFWHIAKSLQIFNLIKNISYSIIKLVGYSNFKSNYGIKIDLKDISFGKILENSLIKVENICFIDRKLFIKKIAVLSNLKFLEVKDKLNEIL